MSCQDFTRVVEELAEGRLMEAAARDAGLAHAAVCVGCAARLMEARGLVAGLKVAARAETEEAPARVREALLASFAETHGKPLSTPQSNVVALPSRRAARWWFAAGAAAAAAVILLSLTLNTLLRATPNGALSNQPQVSATTQPPVAPKPVEKREEVSGILVGKDDAAQNETPKKAPARAAKATRILKGETRRAEVAQVKSDEYLPLTYLSDATAMESGTVVRVELSRSALISLGVPVQPDRTDELLKADVVLGDDGVARAIRLVR